VTRQLLVTAAVAFIALGISAMSGPVHRRAALVGATAASFTAFGSLLAMGRYARKSNSVKAALAVMVVAFLARIVLVGVGTALVVRGGESVISFVLAFFVPYFIFAAIEAWYVSSLRGPGTTA
jgi:hypothetical protein